MSRTDRFWPPRLTLPGFCTGKLSRVFVISLGLGLGTAFATELTVRPEPSLIEPVSDAEAAAVGWRAFDPGFLIDHLPFRLTVGQSISYNDNVSFLPKNFVDVIGVDGRQRLPSRGDFYSDTTISAAARFPQGAETFFFNGTYAPRRYFTDTILNYDNVNVNGGVNYNGTDFCSGTLTAGYNRSQQSLYETAGAGVNETSNTSLNGVANCIITGHISAILTSGISQSENAGNELIGGLAPSFALNNYQQEYVGVGLQYALGGLDTLTGNFTYTNRDFTNRSGIAGLAGQTEQEDFQVAYTRIFSPKLSASASAGFALFSIPGRNGDMLTEPTYSLSVSYRVTPKVSASFTESRSSGAPQAVISDVQTNDTQNFSLSYAYSPKLSFAGSVSHQVSRNPTLQSSGLVTPSLLFLNYTSMTESLVANYRWTPLLTASAAYTHTERSDDSRIRFDAESNVFRVGLFYTR